MSDHFNVQIKLSKKILREKSDNFIYNFSKIEEFIKNEIKEIEKLKKNSKLIIPEIKYSDLVQDTKDLRENIYKRGCVIIRDVFQDKKINKLNQELEEYIERIDRFQFTSALDSDPTRWRKAEYKVYLSGGLFMKYPDEFIDSVYNQFKLKGIKYIFFHPVISINYLWQGSLISLFLGLFAYTFNEKKLLTK